ncbi:MAG: ribonuclease HI family protein [Patescibacteria group bacterium]
MKVSVFTDGGSRGNPGPGGAGVVVYDKKNKNIIFEKSSFLGTVTNNEAEYEALILSLDWLEKNLGNKNIEEIEFFLDSKLVVEQVNKNWKIKKNNLKKFAEVIWTTLKRLSVPYSLQHIGREENKEADALVNQALDSRA